MTPHSHQLSRRGVLLGTGALGLTSLPPITPSAAALDDERRDRPRRGGAMAWLGTSGWRITTPDHTLLVDPYLSRFPVGLAAGDFDPNTRLHVDTGEVLRAVGTPDTIVVTHSHWDHFNDVPFLAREFGARIVGTVTTCQLATSYGVPARQLAPVKGGEQFDLGDLVVRAIPSLHSRSADYSILFPGTRLTPPQPPVTIADLPEGDTLAFAVWRPSGPRAFFMGASDFDDHALRGIEPDVAALAVPSTGAVHDYVPRLMDALDRPGIVIPVHWDDFESPLRNPPRTSAAGRERLDRFTAQVRRVAPGTRIVMPGYLRQLDLL